MHIPDEMVVAATVAVWGPTGLDLPAKQRDHRFALEAVLPMVRESVGKQMDWPAARHAFTDAFDTVFPEDRLDAAEGEG